jgi:hypothetical protein
MEVYFCHQSQKAKKIGNLTILHVLKPHNNGTHLKGIETSFQAWLSGGTIILEILPLLGELYHFLKFPQNTFSL